MIAVPESFMFDDGIVPGKLTHKSELCSPSSGVLQNTMALAHLPVSKRTGNVTPATVTLLTYCALPILRIGDISRRVIEDAGSAKRTSKGKERALT